MITAIVRFEIPKGMTRAEAVALYRQSAPRYRRTAGLIRKYYLLDEEARIGGAVYLWESRAAAEKVYDDAWRQSFIERYGAAPTLTYFETPVVVDNRAGEILEAEGPA